MSSGITRRKGKSGRAKGVECAIYGAKVPRDKAVEKNSRSLPLDRARREPNSMQGAGSPITAYPAPNTGSTFETGGPRMGNELRVELPEKCGCGFENLKVWGTRIEGLVKLDVRCMRCGKVLYEAK